MYNNSLILPIFPVPIFLLPGGITRLRIFEPRYIKMVKLASKGHGFVIFLNRSNDTYHKKESTVAAHLQGGNSEAKATSLSHQRWGSWVEIIDFDQGEDGLLEIDVKCKSLVDILTMEADSDNLHFGEVTQHDHWSEGTDANITPSLSETLEQVFRNNGMLGKLYPNKPIKNASWVIARWLELLPVNVDVKNTFVENHDFNEAIKFIQSIVLK